MPSHGYLSEGNLVEYYSQVSRNVHVGISLGGYTSDDDTHRVIWFGKLDEDGNPHVVAIPTSKLSACNENREGIGDFSLLNDDEHPEHILDANGNTVGEWYVTQ